ncbi:MAG TPA: DUF433 domain-containing protein [Planctomycetaceae bacterium]|nr:DUF433 domain-containing protein [Planctomycetaceae bacterium]
MKQVLGRHIVSDSTVCHGRPTFRGTRIFVSDVLEDVSRGLAWDVIVERWHNSISKDAIAEAVRLASEALRQKSGEPAVSVVGR